jgi:septal ring-binding cell division protein DamX
MDAANLAVIDHLPGEPAAAAEEGVGRAAERQTARFGLGDPAAALAVEQVRELFEQLRPVLRRPQPGRWWGSMGS